MNVVVEVGRTQGEASLLLRDRRHLIRRLLDPDHLLLLSPLIL